MRRTRPLVLSALLATVAATAGCATLGAPDAFEETQRRYTRLVRWSEFQRASEHVDPAERDAYRERAEALMAVRFVDYEIQSVERDSSAATVLVTYHAYLHDSVTAVALREEQRWSRAPDTGAWMVRSTLAQQAYRPERPF